MVWDWLNQNAQPLSFFTNVGTLLVWVLYAHLLLMAFRRQRRPRVLINQGWGVQLDSVCLVSNMSQEPIYVQLIVMNLQADGKEYSYAITDFDTKEKPNEYGNVNQVTRQGPLQPGCYMNIGTFRDLIAQVGHYAGLSRELQQNVEELSIKACDISVLSAYGPEDGVIGARRRFVIAERDGDCILRPEAIDTERMTSRRARKKMRKWLRRHV